MQLSNIPGKLVLPFANAGGKTTIPVASQIGITAGAASLTDGFPPLTRTPIAAGGVPPSGLDMNGILYEMSAIIRWANAGGGYPFDGTFAADSNVGGYPKGARIMRTDGTGYWLNTSDNNETDPESSGAAAAGWVPDFTNGVAAISMASSNITLTPVQYGKPVIVISGTLTANLNLIFPELVSEWTIINATAGNYSITAKTASGTGVPLSAISILVCDGVNVLDATGFLQTGVGATIRSTQDKLREISVSLTDYMTSADRTTNYLAPGAVDVTYAINAWLARLTDGHRLTAPEGKFKFTTPLAIPALDNIAICGAGRQKTFFVYGGASTTIDLLTVGDGVTSFRGLSLQGFNIDSTTLMTAGTGLRIRKCQNGGNAIYNVAFSHLNAPKKLWDGMWFDNVNVIHYVGFEINVQSEAVIANGTADDNAGSDLYLDQGTITFANVGLHVAGGFGGLYVGEVLFFGNTVHSRIDNARAARYNRELIYGEFCVFDGCKDYALHVNDPLASGANITFNAFTGSAGLIDVGGAGVNIYIQSFPSSRITIGSGQIFNATSHGILVDDASTLITIGANTQINNNGGWGIFSSVATTNINFLCKFSDNANGKFNSNIRQLKEFSSVISSGAGALGTASGSIDYFQIGSIVFFTCTITVTDNGTGSVAIGATLPFTVRQDAIICGRASALSGKMLQGILTAGSTTMSIVVYDGTYPATSGEILKLSGSVEVF